MKSKGFDMRAFLCNYDQNKGRASSLFSQRSGAAESDRQNQAILETLKRFSSTLFALLR
jgi:hypothetical protein